MRSFTLSLDGDRPDGLLKLVTDLCADNIDRTMEAKLVAYNGKESSFSQELATPGCDPTARFTIRRKGRRATLVARMRAARVGPGITQFALRLPKTLARGKARPIVFADGGRMRPHTGKRLASMPFPREVRTATHGLARTEDGPPAEEDRGGPPPHDRRPPARDLPEAEGPRARKGTAQEAPLGRRLLLLPDRLEPTPPPPGEVLRLRMAVGAEQLKILEPIVEPIPVEVMKGHRQRRPPPLGQPAHARSDFRLRPSANSLTLQMCAVDGAPGDEEERDWSTCEDASRMAPRAAASMNVLRAKPNCSWHSVIE